MSNMDYCRFRNTSSDLVDCASASKEILEGAEDGLGREEHKAAEHLVRAAIELLESLAEAAGIEWEQITTDDAEALVAKLKKV